MGLIKHFAGVKKSVSISPEDLLSKRKGNRKSKKRRQRLLRRLPYPLMKHKTSKL